MEAYVKFGYPEYQQYQDLDGFDDNSYYDPGHDFYFIDLEWFSSHYDKSKYKAILFEIDEAYFATKSQAVDYKSKN